MSIQLYAMTCGHLVMDYHFFVEGEVGKVAIPIPSFLIKHPKGNVLFDTGLERTLQSHDHATVRTALATMADYATVQYVAGDEVSARLHSAGFDPARIDYLINSHLHLDHCGGNALIPNARWIIQKREWQAAMTPETQTANHYTQRHYDLGHDRREIDGEHDLFGDGSVVCIPTYGHTPGHQSLKIRLDDGDVVLTSDACYMRKSLEKMRLPIPAVVSDPEQMLSTFRRFKAFRDSGAKLIFGHDPDQWKALNSGPLKEVTIKALAAEAAQAKVA